LIAGGGTGGHIVPAIAIGRALVARGHPSSTIKFVGSNRGIEQRLIPYAGFEVTVLPGRGIVRGLTWRNVTAAAGLAVALGKAISLVGRLKPAVVIAVGGYASVACALAAALFRIPLVVAEQNAQPGWANRLAGRFAAACAVSFPATPLPRAVVTGNPVRSEVLAVDRSPAGKAAARAELGLPTEGQVIIAAGGSLGARRINEAVLGLATLWRERSGVSIRHVVGDRDLAEFSARAPRPVDGGLEYQQTGFEQRMDLLLAAADVAVQRSGASTIAELTTVGLPSILVPLPGAPSDHQTANARRLASAGAAVLVPDGELDTNRLAVELDRLLGREDVLAQMAGAARNISYPHAADDVAALAEEYARG
jgi:undecaprenyldiphospho-muramoylpentapeptide beta-N-acetylglucosaminyltransferase